MLVVVVEREIVAPGSLNSGGTTIVVDLSTVEPWVNMTEPPLVVMAVPAVSAAVPVVPAVPAVPVVVVSDMVAPGSLNSGGTTIVVDLSTVGP